MTVIRVGNRKRFTVVAREAVNDERLSFRARGVLFWLLDKPDDWMVNAEQIAKESPEGRDAVRSALRELERAGYLRREMVQGETGRWRTVTTIYESPTPENPSSVAGKPTPGNPTVGKPGAIPSSTVTEDCPPKTVAASVSFDAFWKLYPRKTDKGHARVAYVRALKLTTAEEILSALERQIPAMRKADPKFVPHAATWLNGERWTDETPTAVQKHWSEELAESLS